MVPLTSPEVQSKYPLASTCTEEDHSVKSPALGINSANEKIRQATNVFCVVVHISKGEKKERFPYSQHITINALLKTLHKILE